MDTDVPHPRFGRIAYLRGRPTSEWIDAISKRRRTREQPPPASRRP
jgi:hypothetical protein